MKRIISAILFTAAAAFANTLPTPVMYVSDGTTLFQLDPSTGAVVGSHLLSTTLLAGMTFASDGTLYGIFNQGGIRTLGTIDGATGTVSLLSQSMTPGGDDLAFDGLTLYTVGGDGLMNEVNLATGALTGNSYACLNLGDGVAFGGDGKLWVGNGGQVAQFAQGSSCGGGSGGTSYGASFTGSGPPIPFITDLSYANGTMYALDAGFHNLELFDGTSFPAGGIISPTIISSIPSSYTSLAVYDAVTSTPEPAAFGTLGLGLAGLGLLYRRRRAR